MRLLVTGGAGFIGSHIVDHALRAGWNVGILDNLSSGRREQVPPQAAFFKVDIRDAGAVEAVFKTFSPDVVSHQAAQASVAVSVRDPLFDADVNVIGGLHVLQASVRAGVSQVVFASSGGAVYGEVPGGHAAREDDPARPFSPYATSKLAFETYLETYRAQFGLSSTVLRYGNVYGPRQDPHGEAGVMAIFARRLLRGEPVRVNTSRGGDPRGCVRDYVSVEDVARANLAAVQGRLNGTVNVGSGEGHTTQEVAEALAGALGTPLAVQVAPYRPGDLDRSVLDVSRLRAAGLEMTPFDQGLAQAAMWFQSHSAGGEEPGPGRS